MTFCPDAWSCANKLLLQAMDSQRSPILRCIVVLQCHAIYPRLQRILASTFKCNWWLQILMHRHCTFHCPRLYWRQSFRNVDVSV